MSSFTKQLRQNTGVFARENIEPAVTDETTEVQPEMSETEVEAVLAEPIAEEIEKEVVEPAEEIEEGIEAVQEAEADASTLENTATILEGAAGETSPDVDGATSELANITLERICNKYNIARSVKISKESYSSANNRKALAQSISKEAFEKAAELRKRVAEGIAKIIEWFKNLIKSVFDKSTKLEKRLKAIKVSAELKKNQNLDVLPGSKIKISKHLQEANGFLSKLLEGMKIVADIADSTAGEMKDETKEKVFDFNPSKLGGISLTASVQNGKLVVVKQNVDLPPKEELHPIELNVIENGVDLTIATLNKYKDYKQKLDKIVAEMSGWMQKIKAVAAGEEHGASAKRENIIARYRGITVLFSTISSVFLTTVSEICDAYEQSLAVYKKPAK